MQLGQSLAHDVSNSIVLIKPLKRSYFKIFLWIVLLIGICILLSEISIKLAILIGTTLLIGVYYLISTHNKLALSWFYSQQNQNSAAVTHYAIFDISSEQKALQQQRSQGKVYIVKVHFTKQNANYFKFNQTIYKALNQTVEVINQIDLLDMLKIQNTMSYTRTGLNQQRIQMSESLYGKQKGYMTLSRWQMVHRRVKQDKQWFILMLIAVMIALLWNLQVLLILLIIDLVSGVILYIEQNRSATIFTKKYEWIATKQFKVIREEVERLIFFQDILVGDLIILSKDQQNEEQTIYFKSLLISNKHQIIVQQIDTKERVVKSSLRNEGQLISDRTRSDKYVIKSQSTIQNSDLFGGQHLIVADNQSISLFFNMWFQKPQKQQYSSLFKQKQKQAAKLIIGYIIFIVALCLVLKITAGTFTQQFDQSIMDQIFLSVLSLPSIIYLLFCLNSLLSHQKLANSNIQVFGNTVHKAALINNMLLNFSDLVELQLSKVLSKYQIFDLSIPPFDPNTQTLRNSASYESLLALILYVSLGHFQQKDTFLKKVFQRFEERYAFQESLGAFEDVVHVGGHKKWSILRVFPEVETGWRSWLLKYDNRTFYVITQGTFRQDNSNFQKLIGSRQDKTKVDVYISTAQTLIQEGKKFKFMFFRSLKDRDRTDKITETQSQDLQRTEAAVAADHNNLGRQRLQKNLEFGAFIIFDNAFKLESIKAIQTLSKAKTQSDKRLLNIAFYSSKGKQTMAGFEHLLMNIPFNYELSQHEKYLLVIKKIKEGGALVIGSKEDQPALQAADISVQLDRQIDGVMDNLLIPSDICLKELTSISTLLDTGNWMVWIQLETVKFVLLVTMSQIVSLLFLGTRGDYAVIDHPLLWGMSQSLLFILLPLIMLNFIPVNSLLCSKNKYNFFTVTFVSQILTLFMTIVVLIIAAGSDSICPPSSALEEDHQSIRLRVHFLQSTDQDCLNIPLMVTATSGVILFSIIYLEQNWIALSQEWWRYLIIGLWIGVMLISNLPMNLFWVGLCLLAVLVLIKYFIKLAILKPRQP